jgi:hypothetical protein
VVLPPVDPPVNASLFAFNYTQSQGDLYTNSSKGLTISPNPNATAGTNFFWKSTVNRTNTGNLIPGSAFRFNLTTFGVSASKPQVVNWTLTIPKGNCPGCATTDILFDFFGNLTKGTIANYTTAFSTNGSRVAGASGGFVGPQHFPPPPALVPLNACPEIFCIDVTKYIGYNLTLSFTFNWNSSQTGMAVDVGEIAVTSRSNTQMQSTSNYMMLNSTDTTKITHFTNLSKVNYNSNVTYPNPKGGPPLTHTWSMEILNIYYGFGYSINQAILNPSLPNSTTLFPAVPRVPFDTCNDPSLCNPARIAFNMSDITPFLLRNSTVTLRTTTQNSISSLDTVVSTAPTYYWSPGDNITVKVKNQPAGNVTSPSRTGSLNFTFIDPKGSSSTIAPQRFFTLSGGIYGFTMPTVPASEVLGIWSVNATFVSAFDFGIRSTTFKVQQIVLKPGSFSYSGSNTQLAVVGTLSNASNGLPVANLPATVFAVDTGSGHSPLSTTNSSNAGLYISNITLINAVFTSTQPLTLFFTVVNPTPAQGFSANLTIQQEWSSGQTHGASANLNLTLGDQPFIFGPAVYRADILIQPSRIQITVTSLARQNQKTITGSLGLPPIVPSRQHSGLFKISIGSKALTSTASYSNSLESPIYAYLSSQAATALIPSSLLTSETFSTATDGSFAITIISNRILAAKKLVLFVLARDANGVVLGNQDPTAAPPDSTILQSNTTEPSQIAEGQQGTITLHLNNTSTKIVMNINISLNIQGGAVFTQSKVNIPPGPKDIQFIFNAPSSPGTYTMTFSSPEYGAPLASTTLQVSIFSGSLQILIPSIIGLVGAIVIAGFYMIRRRPEKELQPPGKEKQSTGKPPKSSPSLPSSKSLT